MLNKDKYATEILRIIFTDNSNGVAILRKDGKLTCCKNVHQCSDCLLNSYNSCSKGFSDWANSEFTPIIDWSAVQVDAKILVSEDGSEWFPRHFAKYESGKVFAWTLGQSSFTVKKTYDCSSWDYAKLYDEH